MIVSFLCDVGVPSSIVFYNTTTFRIPVAEDKVHHLQQVHKEVKTMISIVGE